MENTEITPEQILEAVQNLSDTNDRDEIFSLLEKSEGKITPEISEKMQQSFAKEAQHQKEILNDTKEEVADLDEQIGSAREERKEEMQEVQQAATEVDQEIDNAEESMQKEDEAQKIADLKNKLG